MAGSSLLPDLGLNGSDLPLLLRQGELLDVTVSLEPGSFLDGLPADWWVVAVSPSGLHGYTLESGWVPSAEPLRACGGPLFPLAPLSLLETRNLPTGEYLFLFSVDLQMNGLREEGTGDTGFVTVSHQPGNILYRVQDARRVPGQDAVRRQGSFPRQAPQHRVGVNPKR